MPSKPLALAAAAAALAVPLVAPAVSGAADPVGVVVCNEAQNSFRGVEVVSDPTDPNPPARHKEAAMPVGLPDSGGLLNAAAHSPALAVCGEPDGDSGGGGGGDGGGNPT